MTEETKPSAFLDAVVEDAKALRARLKNRSASKGDVAMTEEKKPFVHELQVDPYMVGWEPFRTFPLDGNTYLVMGEDGTTIEAYYDHMSRTVVLKGEGPGPAKLTHWKPLS
jgi:hypothetical protein